MIELIARIQQIGLVGQDLASSPLDESDLIFRQATQVFTSPGGQIVNHRDAKTLLHKPFGQVRSDKARPPGDDGVLGWVRGGSDRGIPVGGGTTAALGLIVFGRV